MMDALAKPLNVPPAGAMHFSRNFIRLAACELRFPTLFELEAERPPFGSPRRSARSTHCTTLSRT
jgi:hypothetical protein